jgi:hypothetical protein
VAESKTMTNDIREAKEKPKCPRCGSTFGHGTICVLGGGGDYENWPCPECRPHAFKNAERETYGSGMADPESE